MKGYILNLTVRGEGVVKMGINSLSAAPVICCCSRRGSITTGATRMPKSGITSGSISVRAPTGRSGSWPAIFAQTGLYRPDEAHLAQFRELFAQIIEAGQAGGRYAELLAINLLEQVLLRRMEAINESLNPPLDNRVRDACQYISDHLADSQFDIASVAQHVPVAVTAVASVPPAAWRERTQLARGSAHQPGETAAQHHPNAYRHRRA